MTDNTIIQIAVILIGLALCTHGFKIQKLLITVAWFCVGFSLASWIAPQYIDSNTVCLIISIVAGLILGSLGFKLEKIALLIAVAYMVYISVGPYIKGFEKDITTLIQLGVSVIVGLLAVFFIKPIMIVTTSLTGSNLIKSYLPLLVTIPGNILNVIIIIIFVAGIIYQFKTS